MALKSLLPLAFAAASMATVVPRQPGNDGFLSFPIEHATRVKTITKRDADVPLYNISFVSYLIQLGIGSNSQNVKVAIDTGSDELWVDPVCDSQGLEPSEVSECESDGSYNPKTSTSSTVFSNGTTIQYGKGAVQIEYVSDSITLPGSSATMSNVQFGVALKSQELNEGILGLGWGLDVNLNYSNFVDSLAEQKVTNSKAFSVALGSVDASNGGVIIFGGIDTKKFTGSLVTNKMLGPQDGEAINRYWIQMTSVGLDKSGSTKTYTGGNTPVVLDSGSSLSYLPDSVLNGLVSDLGATYNSQYDLYLLSCSQSSSAGTIDFAFGSVTIKVPISDFIIEADTSGQTCALGAGSASTAGITALLGDTFLRSAYVVFDQTQNTISMAQYSNCGTSEQTIPAGGVGSVTGGCSGTSTNAAGRAAYSTAGLAVALLAGVMVSFF